MILVADAAPLIFLAKINQLSLIFGLFDAEILIPAAVESEVLGLEAPPDEERLLTGFLASCRVPAQRTPTMFAKALSFADNCILTLAIEKQADLILSDDRLLRKTAAIEGFRVIGTIGVLIRAAKSCILAPQKTVALQDELVRDHNFRISTRVYEIARNAIGKVC
jgi:predicted nucleic acid-binding protein